MISGIEDTRLLCKNIIFLLIFGNNAFMVVVAEILLVLIHGGTLKWKK